MEVVPPSIFDLGLGTTHNRLHCYCPKSHASFGHLNVTVFFPGYRWNICFTHGVWKSQKKSQFTTLWAKRAIFSRQKFIKNAKNGQFSEDKLQMRHFEWFSNNVFTLDCINYRWSLVNFQFVEGKRQKHFFFGYCTLWENRGKFKIHMI